MARISVVIPTLNVENIIERSLKSVDGVDEIIVVDMGSTDKTLEICKKYGAKIFKNIPEDGNFDKNRLLGMQKATGDWILKLDSDEELTPGLQKEIKELMTENSPKEIDGYNLYNNIFLFGRQVKYGFVKPCSHELRLIRNGKWEYNPIKFHQQIIVGGNTAFLKNRYNHYNYQSISQFLFKTNKYTDYDSKYFYREGYRVNLFGILLAPAKSFIKLFFIQKGFLDGEFGLMVCFLYSLYNFLEKLKIYELEHFKDSKRGPVKSGQGHLTT
ncbi:MAG: glycosyltransferase family 2 protein [Patescibacteria group bacterium]